ncbi:DUF1800 domain-containing protein [Deinococcus maricopensis]|uniref:DUF1800 domain-containing protein n=1 Tax=Deinococcus maricopensis (strain DSM 21211 / LMG 22137 / NRRL B-23946 / LB-34) TaxID=709986 RepID=E8U5M8_DEIML|nr:DUF1800 domain-containing protein [Deinococcus maricopensis]ADV66367.1 protein of unknown function DUF1800 [Deinococcus maricopensis DSM 21211]
MALTPYQPRTYTPEDAAHLARRAGFGATDAEIRALQQLGPQGAARKLLDFPQTLVSGNPFKPENGASPGAGIKLTQTAWLFEMLYTPHPLRERLALLWSNHFVIGTDKVRNLAALGQYLTLLRTHAAGEFTPFATDIAKSPAMLRYLDNDQNRKGKPNENFSRELLELFTTGIGPYSERDVQEGARALTGWTFTGGRGNKQYLEVPKFAFQVKNHDAGRKTYLGQSGAFTPEQVVALACAHPATGDFVARKLWRAFVNDTPDETGVRALGDVFRAHGGNLRVTLEALLTSEAFYAPGNRASIIRSPVEFVVGALRSMGRPKLDEKQILNLTSTLARLGQDLLKPPNVKGWDGGREWINDSSLLLRMQTAAALTLGKNAPKVDAPPSMLALTGHAEPPAALRGLKRAQATYLTLISPEFQLL